MDECLLCLTLGRLFHPNSGKTILVICRLSGSLPSLKRSSHRSAPSASVIVRTKPVPASLLAGKSYKQI
jgi:hypothetical protein